MGVSIYGASVDPLGETPAMVEKLGLTFPIAHGVTRADADALGAWWDQAERHGGFYIQPSEFLLSQEGIVLDSVYASGAVGRLSVAETVTMITGRERRRREQEG